MVTGHEKSERAAYFGGGSICATAMATNNDEAAAEPITQLIRTRGPFREGEAIRVQKKTEVLSQQVD